LKEKDTEQKPNNEPLIQRMTADPL